jgi:phosphohistidine phosphatase
MSPRAGRGKPSRRRLLLLRHAKAERDPEVEDSERPLAPRGRRDAGRMGQRIADLGLAPEQVLCSPARRTRETLDRVLPHLPEGLAVVFDRELYLAGPERILARIAAVDDRVQTLLVVGHNPGLAELAEQLARGGDAEALARLRHKFPTCGVAEIESPALRWRDLAAGGGILAAFLTPREVAGAGG